jgi:cytochrome c oxidase subunit 4
MSEHAGSAKLYWIIWATLIVLTFVTAGVAKLDLGAFNTVVALGIATVKALLVVLFFMHVKGASERMTKIVVVSAICWLILLLTLTLADYATGRPLSTP